MGLDLTQFKELIVVPTLVEAPLNIASASAINIVTGTCLKESALAFVHQIGVGPALGVAQMEPTTHDWLLNTYLANDRLLSLRTYINTLLCPGVAALEQLVFNLRYAVIMARVKYLSEQPPLPLATNAAALCAYYKQFYNSSLGKAVDDAAAVAVFQQAIDA